MNHQDKRLHISLSIFVFCAVASVRPEMPLPLEPDPPNGIRRPGPPELDKATYPLEDLKPEEVLSIQERWINVNEYYKKEDAFVVCLHMAFLPIPPDESDIDRVCREIKGGPVIVLGEDEAKCIRRHRVVDEKAGIEEVEFVDVVKWKLTAKDIVIR